MAKRTSLLIILSLLTALLLTIYFYPKQITTGELSLSKGIGSKLFPISFEKKKQTLKIKKLVIKSDKDKDGKWDLDDIVEGARKDAKNKPEYISKYYRGGYPPKNEGVCTDVIWRAFKNAGYNLKRMVDQDIKKHRKDYTAIKKKPDPNIDFRRVVNLYVFFKKYGKSLTTKLKPNNTKNLFKWQGGDIVTFDEPSHIAIVSSKRAPNGVPYLIHNYYDHTRESNDFSIWIPYITGHFRYPKK